MADDGKQPWQIESMQALLSMARALEQEAIAGYTALAERMRREHRLDLAAVFETLCAEEQGHLGNVDRWIEQSAVAIPAMVRPQQAMFDDEGASLVAPELLSSYRAFSMAVRNEERAFVFWTYVAAHAPSDEIREAAEQMAREELGHVATLRRERRRAFHNLRHADGIPARPGLAQLELRLADQLEAKANEVTRDEAERLRMLAVASRARSGNILAKPYGRTSVLDNASQGADTRLVPLCELILDAYLDLAEHERNEDMRAKAQFSAGALIECLVFIRE